MPVARIVTTSWDDGNPQDIKVASLLRDRALAGTFYVPIAGPNNSRLLGAAALRGLRSQGFEIGAHGMSHRTLPQLSDHELRHEVGACRTKLEDTLGDRVRMFCYPKGQYDARVIQEVRRAGYEGARTTEMLGCRRDVNPYRMPTTVHAFPHTKVAYLRNMARAMHFRQAIGWTIHCRNVNNWIELAKTTFDQVIQDGGVWHLCGHSWAIEKYNLWDDLVDVLNYVARREGITYLSNYELLESSSRCRLSLTRDRRATAS